MGFSSLMSQLNLINISTWTCRPNMQCVLAIECQMSSISFRGGIITILEREKTKFWNSGFCQMWVWSENEKRIVQHKSPSPRLRPSKMSFFTTRTDCQMSIFCEKFGQISILGEESVPVTLCVQGIKFHEQRHWGMYLLTVIREAILYQIECFFTHCVKGGRGVKPMCKNLCCRFL